MSNTSLARRLGSGTPLTVGRATITALVVARHGPDVRHQRPLQVNEALVEARIAAAVQAVVLEGFVECRLLRVEHDGEPLFLLGLILRLLKVANRQI